MMKFVTFLVPFLSIVSAFTTPSSSSSWTIRNDDGGVRLVVVPTTTTTTSSRMMPPLQLLRRSDNDVASSSRSTSTSSELGLFKLGPKQTEEEAVEVEVVNTKGMPSSLTTTIIGESSEGEWIDESKKVELILLGIWGISISAFILINNFTGPWPEVMRHVPERIFFLSHMVGGMLFGGGIILTTCIERLVAKSNNAPVLQFWFDKVPLLDGLIVVPALTVSMVSGTGLSIVRYGGLNIAPPHVGAIFWTLIAFMTWWAATDLTTQGGALTAANEMYAEYQEGNSEVKTPDAIMNRHVSNVVSCFFVLVLYSFMVLKPGTLFPFPWNA